MTGQHLLAIAAALLTGTPDSAGPGGVIWIELCDAAHPGRRVPLPLDRDDGPAKVCHAACGVCPVQRRMTARR